MTRDEFLALVRTELQDSGATYVWPDEQLLEFLAESLQRLSRDVPLLTTFELGTITGQRDYLLSGVWAISTVELPAGVIIPAHSPGWVAEQQTWERLQTGTNSILRLRYAVEAGSWLVVRARSYYEFPASGDSELAIADEDRALLKWLICERAFGWLGQLRTKRGETGTSLVPGYYENLYRLTLRSRQLLQSSVVVAS